MTSNKNDPFSVFTQNHQLVNILVQGFNPLCDIGAVAFGQKILNGFDYLFIARGSKKQIESDSEI